MAKHNTGSTTSPTYAYTCTDPRSWSDTDTNPSGTIADPFARPTAYTHSKSRSGSGSLYCIYPERQRDNPGHGERAGGNEPDRDSRRGE